MENNECEGDGPSTSKIVGNANLTECVRSAHSFMLIIDQLLDQIPGANIYYNYNYF